MGEYRSMEKHAKMLGNFLTYTPDVPSLLQANSRSCSFKKQGFKHRSAVNLLSILCFSVMLGIYIYFAFASEITIIGEVNYFYQIMADDQIYGVANTAMGDQLVMNHIAKKVEVTGTVDKKGELKKITVKSYRVVPEVNPYSH